MLNWIHLDFSDTQAANRFRKESGMEPTVLEALLEDDTRPRSAHFDEGVLVILRGVNMNPDSDLEDMISIRIWLEEGRVITTGRRRLRSVQAIRESIEAGMGPNTPAEFLVALVNKLDEFVNLAVEQMEGTLESAEESIQDSTAVARNSPFSRLRRQSARIRRYLGPQRDALDRLSRTQTALFNDDDRTRLAEEANRTTLLLENLDLVRERAMVAQEEFLAIVAHEQNTRMLLLSVVSAIFLPLAFLTGLMGMNVAGLPGTENEWAFLILCGFMVLAAVVILSLFRAKKWL